MGIALGWETIRVLLSTGARRMSRRGYTSRQARMDDLEELN